MKVVLSLLKEDKLQKSPNVGFGRWEPAIIDGESHKDETWGLIKGLPPTQFLHLILAYFFLEKLVLILRKIEKTAWILFPKIDL